MDLAAFVFGEKSRLRSRLDHFSVIEDPRDARRVAHPLAEVLLLVVCGTPAKIIDAGTDYLLAVKANQPTLRAEVESLFETAQLSREDGVVEWDNAHGRIERRAVSVVREVDWLGGDRRFLGGIPPARRRRDRSRPIARRALRSVTHGNALLYFLRCPGRPKGRRRRPRSLGVRLTPN